MQRLFLSHLDRARAAAIGDEDEAKARVVLAEVRRAVQAAQRCIVITGAGISVSSGIPDFRSPDGLFQQLKQKYPNAVSTGKDLFDATLFSDPAMIGLFYSFMGELRNLVSRATCTPTHSFIKELDEAGKLLRCYTQNIDSLEKRIGLETSFQSFAADTKSQAPAEGCSPVAGDDTPCSSPPSLISDSSSSLDTEDCSAPLPSQPTEAERKALAAQRRIHRRRQTTLDKTFTRAVQLHGDLDNVVCTICHTKYPFTEQMADEFCEGAPPPCPRCKEIEMIRDLVGKRSVASGVLRPDIVLYNECHPQSELIGSLSEYDLKRRPDLLIVIGTSLKIPGIKRMVKEMAHSVHSCALRSKRAGAGKVIFINRDEPPSGWDSVFDYYVSGDSDHAIELLPITSSSASLATEAAAAPSLAQCPAIDNIKATAKASNLSCQISVPASRLLPAALAARRPATSSASAVAKRKAAASLSTLRI
ncbi:NAD-dependent deacetylase hst3 [Coemansia sp. RSA 2320]|nr:NAD-dependent deacetylase hst3 [Coemansia sp. RSA 2320]